MFNIIKTPRNYILHANYYTTVMWHFTAKKSLAVILEGKLFGEVFCRPITAPVTPTVYAIEWSEVN